MSSNYVNIPRGCWGADLPPVNDIFDLPSNGNNLGDTRLVLDTHLYYFWNGSAWLLVPANNGGGGGEGSNASVGPTGTTAPTSATEIGGLDAGGNLQALTVDPSGKLLVDISGSSTVTGTVNANIEGLNTFQTSQQTVGLSAVQLTPTPLTNRSGLSAKAITTGTNIIYIGNSSAVTTSTGYPLFNGDSLELDLTGANAVWAIASAAAQTLAILEIG